MSASASDGNPSGVQKNIPGSREADLPTIEQFDRYLAGESPIAEVTMILRWIDEIPNGEQIISELRRMTVAAPPDWDPFANWSDMESRLGSELHQEQNARPVQKHTPDVSLEPSTRYGRHQSTSFWTAPRMKFGALALGAVTAVVWGVVSFLPPSPGAPRTVAALYPSVYATGHGERGFITLPDSTVVALSVGSRLEVDPDFARGNRIVRVEGEAFFTVRHKQGSPFTVKAGKTVTRVLGTSFAVRKYPGDTLARISVRDGRVMVESTVLTANQEILARPGQTSPIIQVPAGRFSFTQGILTLNEISLKEAIPELNRWYNADIQLADESLARAIVGGQFPGGSLLELTEQLTVGLDVRIERSGRILTLKRRGN